MIAYFCDGKDISNIDVLTNIGINFGINETAVVQMFESDSSVDLLNSNLERAHELGITAVPTYVFDEQWSVPGAQDSEMFERIIRRFAEQSTSS